MSEPTETRSKRPPPTRRYLAFISYRHADNTQEGRRWAEWLHRALERYVVPPDLIGTRNLRGEPIRDSLYPIFRDEDELPANADLATGIRAALEVSDHLIVLCSPRSAVSPWVRKEVREFKELGRGDRILAIIIAGEPNADDPVKAREGIMRDEECFCEELRFGAKRADDTLDWTARVEPTAADLRPTGTRAEGFVTAEAYREHLTLHSSHAPEKIAVLTDTYRQRLDQALLKVIAGLLGVPLGQLIDRDAAHRAELAKKELARAKAEAARLRNFNRRLAMAGALALMLALLAGLFWWQALTQTERAETQTSLAEKRGRDLEDAAKEQERLLHEASMADYAVAVQRIEKDGKWHEGVAHLARALKWWNRNPLAAARLYSTLSFYAPEMQTWPRAILRHEANVISAQFSPDGSRIVTASGDKTAQVWDLATGKPLGKPLRHEGHVVSAKFSLDGLLLVTATFHPGSAQIWEVATGAPLGEVLRHEDPVLGAQFSPDGTRIITASGDHTARIWNAATGQPIGVPLRHGNSVLTAQFSRDGERVLTASVDKTAQVWEAATGRALGEPLRHEGRVVSAQFSPDGLRIVTASDDQTARLWEAATGKPLGEPLRHESAVTSSEFSPDGLLLVTTSYDKSAQIWEVATGEPLGEPLRHKSGVLYAGFSPDGQRIVTASFSCARVWEAATGKPLGEPLVHERAVKRAQFSPDGLRIVTLSEDNNAQVWDAATGKPLGEPLRHTEWVKSGQFSRDGSRIVTASYDQSARIWDAVTGQPLGDPLRHKDGVMSAQFSPNGLRILTASDDKNAWLWELATGKILGEPLRHQGTVFCAQFSPDGERIVTASFDRTARVWDAATGKPLGEPLPHESAVISAQFSSDGQRIVTASVDDTARVWETATGKALGEPLRHRGDVFSAQFSPDGRRILTGSLDTTARVWDAVTGKPLGEPLPHKSAVISAQFSPDGRRIVTASADATARVWEMATGKALGEPLRHRRDVSSAQFSPNGQRIITASSDHTARVWDVSKLVRPPVRVPNWMLACAHAIAGLEFDADGALREILAEARRSVLLAPTLGEDDWSRMARWLEQPANERTLTPDSRFTCRQIAERERDSGFKEGIESALRYDPTVPLAHVLLAKWEDNPQRAAFLRGYGLKLLPDDASLWARASASLVEQKDFPRALKAADKALALDPKNADAQKAWAAAMEGMKGK